MKVLLVHKFYYPRGGDAVVFFDTARLLNSKGHRTFSFSMNHPDNLPSEQSGYFVSNMDLDAKVTPLQALKIAGRVLYSFEAKEKIVRLVRELRPDIAHVHNICHYLSPSVIDALYDEGIPTVMTLHDYKLTCPAYLHLRNGLPCEECRNGAYYHALLHRCTKQSYLKSALATMEMYLHQVVLKSYSKIDSFISPSRFLIRKTEELGYRGNFQYLPNFVNVQEFASAFGSTENRVVYFGRLSPEKGLLVLLEAMRGLDDVVLNIVGEGPQEEEVRNRIRDLRLNNVHLKGFLKGTALKQEVADARCVVVPSVCYEINPRSALEAFAWGKPVIGARIGGIPELVRDGETGYTFNAGDAGDLRDKIRLLVGSEGKAREMGRQARNFVENEMNPDKHYDGLIKIYGQAVRKRSSLAKEN